jgi:uncharacterized protein
MELKTVYFEDVTKNNTDETIRLASQRATELGIKSIVVASTSGETGVKAASFFKGYNLVIVGLPVGLREPNVPLMPEERRKAIESAGGKVVLSAPAFSGVGGAAKDMFHVHSTGEIIANTLRIFGQGMKVVCEIAIEAVDFGYIKSNEPVISIAGTGRTRGSDTAVVMSPANSNRFFELKVHEIICTGQTVFHRPVHELQGLERVILPLPARIGRVSCPRACCN